jgi:hypothetical protein
MNWSSVSPTVLPLAGVVIGACGTLLGQHLALRVDERRETAKRASDQRAERKEAIIDFLSATERVEHYRGQLTRKAGPDAENLAELMHAVWLAKKIIELVCSGGLAQAAQDFTVTLNRACQELRYNGPDRPRAGLSDTEHQLRVEFIEAARRELGFAGEPLLRRTRPHVPPRRIALRAGRSNLAATTVNPGSHCRRQKRTFTPHVTVHKHTAQTNQPARQ